MTSYRYSDLLQPGLYYSVLYPNVDDRSGRESQQHDVAATLRFDFNPNWIFKAEAHYMSGTAGVSSSLNDYRPLTESPDRWTVFLLKTTVFF